MPAMQRLTQGFAVFGVDDRRLGQVRQINECCFEVAPPKTGESLCLVPDAIFNVAEARVTLVCSNEEVARYLCERHRPTHQSWRGL
jgi:hypothetical protein